MADKLARNYTKCEVCEDIIINPIKGQTKHAHCSTTKKKLKIAMKKFSEYNLIKLSNGVEVIDNIMGKEAQKRSEAS